MNYFDRYPNLFRLAAGIAVVFLFGLAVFNFYHFASSPTDENWFRNPASNLYVTKSFPGHLANQSPSQKADGATLVEDSVRVGDLLLAVNRPDHKGLPRISEALENMPGDSVFNLYVFRLTEKRALTYRVNKAAVPDSFFREIPPTAYVFDVIKGGASERAGMKVGDLIFRINGQGFRDSWDADRIMHRAQIGKAIAYEVIRDNREVTLQVTLAKFGAPISLLVLFISGLMFMGTGTFVAMQRPQFRAARLTGLAFLMVGFFMAASANQRDIGDLTVVRNLTFGVCLFFGIAIWFHSDYYFPKERPELLAKRWLQYVPYLFALLGLVFVVFAGKKEGNLAFVGAIFAMLVLTIAYNSIIRFIYRKQRTAEHKKLSRVIRWTGWIAGLAAFAIGVFMSWHGLQIQFGYIGIPLMLIPLSYLYTIGRYRLLDLDLRMRRNMQYTLVSVFWGLLLLVVGVKILLLLPEINFKLPNIRLTGASVEIVDTPMEADRHQLIEKVVVMFLAIGLAYGFWRISRAGQRVIDRKYYRGQYDYRRAASALAEVMATKLNMVDLARGIVQKLAELMHLKRTGVMFFRNQKVCCCQEAYGFDHDVWQEICIVIDQKLLQMLQHFRSEVRFSVDYLPAEIKQDLHRHGFRHLIPIRSQEKLVGVLLVGEKLSETPFHQDDLEFLAAVAKQASVAIENAFLYEELAGQERLKHELAIARRIQLASLPQTTPKVSGLDIAGISIPAMEVGGDYFDYLNGVANEITVIVGDVSGKGTSAALYMSKVQGILRSLHGFKLSPRELFIRTNQLLCQDLEKKSFVTSIGADFDTNAKRLVLARAGHLPLFYYHAKTQAVEKITPKGLGLGLDNHGVFASELEEKIIHYEMGDVFLFVTDGVTEAQSNSGGEFGEESLVKGLVTHAALRADLIRDHLIAAVKNFSGDAFQHDDQTVVVVKAM